MDLCLNMTSVLLQKWHVNGRDTGKGAPRLQRGARPASTLMSGFQEDSALVLF